MTENINGIKAAVAAVIAALTALWGWYGWFICILALCMLLDYITGSAAGMKAGEWSSKTARTGLWHKLAILVAVLVAAILDTVVGMIVNNIPSVTLPFEYTVIFGPLVVAWYILSRSWAPSWRTRGSWGTVSSPRGSKGPSPPSNPAWTRPGISWAEERTGRRNDQLKRTPPSAGTVSWTSSFGWPSPGRWGSSRRRL